MLLVTTLIVCLLLTWALLFPLGAAYRAGMIWAHDPTHRLVTRDPWFVFDTVVARRLRYWRWVWLIGLLASYPISIVLLRMAGLEGSGVEPRTGRLLEYALIGPESILIFGLLNLSALLFLIPHVRFQGALMGLSLAVATILMIPIFAASFLAFSLAMGLDADHGNGIGQTIPRPFGIHLLTAAVVGLAVGGRYWARHAGERWFRFDT